MGTDSIKRSGAENAEKRKGFRRQPSFYFGSASKGHEFTRICDYAGDPFTPAGKWSGESETIGLSAD
jgi:hypothetical protein